MPSFLSAAVARFGRKEVERVQPDFSQVGVSKAKPEDFDRRTHLPDGRERLIMKQSLLTECDTLVLIDDSGSMQGTYWDLVAGELALVTDVLIQNDPDGIDLFFLNHLSNEVENTSTGRAGTGYLEVQNPDYILNKFSSIRPTNGTPTPERLGLILEKYLDLCEKMNREGGGRPRPLNIIVWTDGWCANTLEMKLVNAARRLDAINAPANQCGVQFLQVGNVPGVDTWLQQLDDKLQETYQLTRDMVDTKKYSAIEAAGGFNAKTLVDVIIGALSKRHDRKTFA